MKTKTARNTGKLGEEMATSFLKKEDFTILSRNYRFARGEIDIVARKDDTLVFVEVKTAATRKFGPPETWVNHRKQQQIGMVAEHYLQEFSIEAIDCRFDVIAVQFDKGLWTLKHIKNAFWL